MASSTALLVTPAFTRALPKAELHAHLTGSISLQTLHIIWQSRVSSDSTFTLPDPSLALKSGGAVDIKSFFPLFDQYIYALVDDASGLRYATHAVLRDFQADGVRYLELRTTPREVRARLDSTEQLSKGEYVEMILDVLAEAQAASERISERDVMSTRLILSIDRRNTLQQALDTVSLAVRYQARGVVGIDLCGNPLRGDVSLFTPALKLAREAGLKITLHFAEVPASSTAAELQTLLSWQPDRLGHVIHTTPDIEAELLARPVGLELCLSCNVLASMTDGGFRAHHFGKWWSRRNEGRFHIALSTDDVGIFESALSNEYFLAAQHFALSRVDIIALSRSAMATAFASDLEKRRFETLLCEFEAIASHID